jgi:putative tryptophan/tyrosine transport system substrate-binding protein
MTEISAQRSGVSKSEGRSLMSRRIFCFALCPVLLALSFPAEAQQPKKIPRIGYLATRSGPSSSEAAFLQGLQSLGYIEGQTIAIEWRYAQGKFDRLPELASELVRLKVDVIVTSGGYATVQAVQKATRTIPIVMTNVNDAVALGLVTSLARPGGNTTGISSLTPELSGKMIELAKETIPKASRVATLANPSGLNWKLNRKEMEDAARSLGMQLLVLEMRRPDDLESAFDGARKKRADILVLPAAGLQSLYRKRIVELAAQSHLPVMGSSATWAEEGCLLAYGPSTAEFYRRAATYVDKILKGAKPADLPVERPTKFEFVINLKTAKQLGLTIPPTVLARADRVIK